MSGYITGIDPSTTSTSAQFKLGALGTTFDGKVFQYVQADGTGFSAGDAVVLTSAFVGDQATTTTTAPGTGAGKAIGVPTVAFAASEYGWVQRYGAISALNVGSSCAVYTILNSTATAGRLDDDATAGAEVIDGIVTTAAESSNSAAAFLQWPKVGRTL